MTFVCPRGRVACICIFGKAQTVPSVEVLFASLSLLAPTKDFGKRPFGPIVTPLAGVGDPHCPFRSKQAEKTRAATGDLEEHLFIIYYSCDLNDIL